MNETEEFNRALEFLGKIVYFPRILKNAGGYSEDEIESINEETGVVTYVRKYTITPRQLFIKSFHIDEVRFTKTYRGVTITFHDSIELKRGRVEFNERFFENYFLTEKEARDRGQQLLAENPGIDYQFFG